MEASRCLNCSSPLSGNYCQECGQPASTGRITFRETVSSYLSSAFSIEGKYLGTLRLLIRNPGLLFREYLAGRRMAYYKPAAFFLLNTAIYILIRALLDYDPLEGRINNIDKDSPEYFNLINQAARFMINNINYILFFLVFSIAVWFKAFYRRRYNFAEYLSTGFYIAGIYILISILNMLINQFTTLDLSSFQLVILGVIIIYDSIGFFRPVTALSVIKGVAVGLLSVLFYMIFSFGFSMLVVYFIKR